MKAHLNRSPKRRRGAIIILLAFLLVPLAGMVAFAIDLGYLSLVRTQLQRTADAAALAAASQLPVVSGATNQTVERQWATSEAIEFAAYTNAAQVNHLALLSQDVTLGYAASPSYYDGTLGVSAPFYNAARVRVRCDTTSNGPVALFFAPLFRVNDSPAMAEATAVLERAGNGFRPGSALIPFALEVETWKAVRDGAGKDSGGRKVKLYDNFGWNQQTYTVTAGGDGTKEVYLYGDDKENLNTNGNQIPGNWGTIDIGPTGNSTTAIGRQLLYGPSQWDFDQMVEGVHDNVLSAPFTTGGDTGISSGFKDDIAEILGKPRIIPLYDTVEGTGNTAKFHIVGFVGIVITEVHLTGNPKYVRIQPGFVVDRNSVTVDPGSPDTQVAGGDSGLYSRLRLVD